jgi:mono/diheme cytochrome c family protein
MFKKVVTVVEGIAVLATVAFVVLLFVAKPAPLPTKAGATGADPPGGPAAKVAAVPAASHSDGAAIFRAQCAGCHGAQGQGSFGPQLAQGRVAQRFPDPQSEINVVTKGRGSMPAFGASLAADQIAAVVAYTRTL